MLSTKLARSGGFLITALFLNSDALNNSFMATAEDIFHPVDPSEFDKSERHVWDLLVEGLRGKQVPESALDQFSAWEASILGFYCQELCIYCNKRLKRPDWSDASAEMTASLIQGLHTELVAPMLRLPFSDESKEIAQGYFTASLRNRFSVTQLSTCILEFLKVHELNSIRSQQVLTQLRQIGKLDVETDKAIATILPCKIYELVERLYKGVWARSVLSEVVDLAQVEILPTLTAIGIYDSELKDQIARLAREKLAELRVSELFDMILCIEKSALAVADLKAVMHTPELRAKTVSVLQKDCTNRLLNNGVDTASIILFYWDLVKVLADLDPRGVILDKVTPAIHRYLKERPDTVEIIVNGIIGEQGSPLYKLSQELSPYPIEDTQISNDLLDISWQPDPVDAPLDFVKKQTRDIVSTFFMLFDNQEVYIKQLNNVFSEKLLAINSASELTKLAAKAESLKKRFGERQLQNIHVMIRDVRKSIKLQERSHTAHPSLENTNPMVLSQRYWSSINDEKGCFPQGFNQLADQFAEVFEHHYPRRRVSWLPGDSRVSLKLDLEDRTLDVFAIPEQAAVINCFAGVGENSASVIASVLEIDVSRVEKALIFWVAQGVLKKLDEDSDCYSVLETIDEMAQLGVVDPLLDETTGASKKAAEEMMVYWQYIVGMLTNLGSLPVEKIHSFLVMFVPKDDPYVKTKEELEQFLYVMVDQEKLLESDGKFSLKKN